MKLKKIAALCNKTKNFALYDESDSAGKVSQWLGDGSAAYPLHGLPLLDEDSLCKMFDITEKKRAGLYFTRRDWGEGVNVEDTDPGETALEEMELGVICMGRELIPLMGREGIIFIDSKYLAPLEEEMGMLRMFERKTADNRTYIAVKAGLLIRAVISPVEAVNDKFINQLYDMLRECKRALQRPRFNREDGGTPQITWTEVDG